MNNLNSVLLEGIMEKAPVFTTVKGKPKCVFTLVSKRFYKEDGDRIQEETSRFNVEASGKLAETCRDNGEEGRGLRVVGRLKEERHGSQKPNIIVIAEHIEFRPRHQEAE